MEKSKVFFTDMRTDFNNNLLQKLERLVRKAGIGDIDFSGKYTALKIHFGEPGNLAYLRPNYAAVLVELIKEMGGRPFLTDCNTLYVGGRKNALDHLDAAYKNGFSPFSTGCHVIIADGLKGTDEVLVPVENGEHVREAKIGRAVMDADIIVTLNHFKGHEQTGFGGALKNLGMGCGSRAGKMEMHSAGKPFIKQKKCVGCGNCAAICAHDAPVISEGKASIDLDKCVGCGRCIGVCPMDAVCSPSDESVDILNKKIAEYSWAVLHGRPNFHVSLVVDVSPFCDCHSENDVPLVPNVGMFASFDPVALDMACADAVNRQPVMPGSRLAEALGSKGAFSGGSEAAEHGHSCCCGREEGTEKDYFTASSPETDWRVCVDHAVKLGLGKKEYELIEIK